MLAHAQSTHAQRTITNRKNITISLGARGEEGTKQAEMEEAEKGWVEPQRKGGGGFIFSHPHPRNAGRREKEREGLKVNSSNDPRNSFSHFSSSFFVCSSLCTQAVGRVWQIPSFSSSTSTSSLSFSVSGYLIQVTGDLLSASPFPSLVPFLPPSLPLSFSGPT